MLTFLVLADLASGAGNVFAALGIVGGALTALGALALVILKAGHWTGKVDEKLAASPKIHTPIPPHPSVDPYRGQDPFARIESMIRDSRDENRASHEETRTELSKVSQRVARIEGRIEGRKEALEEVREPTGQHKAIR